MQNTATREWWVDRIFNSPLMAMLALATIPLILLDLTPGLSSRAILITSTLDWTIVGFFFVEYAAHCSVAQSKRQFVRSPWSILSLAVIVLPLLGLLTSLGLDLGNNWLTSAPLLRLVRLVRLSAFTGQRLSSLGLHRTLLENRFYHVAAIVLMILVIASTSFFVVETRSGHPLTYGDSLWWGIGYMTTIGSEVVPATPLGRVLGGTLMLVGLAFAGVFTANIVSYFERLRSQTTQDERRLDSPGDLTPADSN